MKIKTITISTTTSKTITTSLFNPATSVAYPPTTLTPSSLTLTTRTTHLNRHARTVERRATKPEVKPLPFDNEHTDRAVQCPGHLSPLFAKSHRFHTLSLPLYRRNPHRNKSPFTFSAPSAPLAGLLGHQQPFREV
jgi:hypothetical protein